MMNKKSLILSFVIASLFFSAGFASALDYGGVYFNLRSGGEKAIQMTTDFFGPLFSALLGGYNGDMMLFEKFLLFILVISIVYFSLSRVPGFSEAKSEAVFARWTVAIVIGILGVRFMDYVWLNTILMQYELLAIVLTSIIPFVIYFFFLEGMDEHVLRVIGWILFIMIYFGLWATIDVPTRAEVYLWTMIASVACLIFDNTIHRYYLMQRIKASGAEDRATYTAEIRKRIDEIRDLIKNHYYANDADGEKEIQRLQKLLATINKQL